MKLIRSLKVSGNALLSHKLRTLMALAGIAVGVAAVIIMVAVGRGTRENVADRIEAMGTNLLTVKAGQVRKIIGRERQYGDVTTLTSADADSILSECPRVEAVVPVQDRTLRIKYAGRSTRTMVVGATADFGDVRNQPVCRGRFFTEEESKAGLRTAVIGNKIVTGLFQGRDPIGEVIRIGKVPFEVVGVLETKGGSADGANEDDKIIIPLRTAMRRVFNLRHLKVIYVQVREKEFMENTETEIRELLRERHRLNRRQKADDFTIRNQLTALKMEKEAGDSFTFLITGIAAVALLVGGIGILAIMLLAVKERVNEIGLRMAVGARSKDILLQFLLESLLVGAAGGFVGISMGMLGGWLVGNFTLLPTVIPFNAIVGGLLFSLVVGLFSGVYPARKASMLDPIEALQAD
ncbi:MAG: FtsX-like permease family protein [bacterium]|nr:FtsX-like permease family protein [bacterium]